MTRAKQTMKQVIDTLARAAVLALVLAPALALAQPAGGSAAPAAPGAGSAAAPAGGSAAAPAGVVAPVPAAPAPAASPRESCVAAMNADPAFADDIVKVAEAKINRQLQQVDIDTVRIHTEAQDHVATNQRHVILAYAAMWIVAAGFVLFLWRRQQLLTLEIAQLRRDLEAADKGDK